MRKQYVVQLEGKAIGGTIFEKADPPMGVVFGKLILEGIESGYDFFHSYCQQKHIIMNIDEPEFKCIETQSIDALKVFNERGREIRGSGASISGIEDEGLEIHLFGIPYPLYVQEFAHHWENYERYYNEHSADNKKVSSCNR